MFSRWETSTRYLVLPEVPYSLQRHVDVDVISGRIIFSFPCPRSHHRLSSCTYIASP